VDQKQELMLADKIVVVLVFHKGRQLLVRLLVVCKK